MSVRRRVLVVDDDQMVRGLLVNVLDEPDLVVVLAASAEQAAELIGTAPGFDLAIVDHRLGTTNGLSVVGELRRLQPGCQIMLLSGWTTPDLTDTYLAEGVAAVVTKPFDIRVLLKAVDGLLGR